MIIGTITVGEYNAGAQFAVDYFKYMMVFFFLISGNRGYGGRPNDRADFGNSYNRRRDDQYQNGPRSFDILCQRNCAILMLFFLFYV